MNHIGRCSQPAQQGYRRPAEKSKTLKIVWIAIDFSAIEIVRGIDRVSRRLQRFALAHANARPLSAPIDLQIVDEGLAAERLVNLVVERKDKAGINSLAAEGFGERAGDIGESAGFGKGDSFR